MIMSMHNLVLKEPTISLKLFTTKSTIAGAKMLINIFYNKIN